jgi:glycerol kinase
MGGTPMSRGTVRGATQRTMTTILAIDQSTSGTKAILYDAAGRLLDKTGIEHRQIYPQPGYVEHDAEEIWTNTLAAIGQLAERVGDAIHDAVCLSITNQRETFVVFDRATGRPLHHAIVWQCRRGDPICADLRQRGMEQTISQKTGLKIDTYFTASKLAWLIQNKPDIAQKLGSGQALAGTIDAYLIYRLTGGKVFATDHTNASRTLLFDIRRLVWDPVLCDLFGVPIACLPEVCDSPSRFGVTDANGILKKTIPICGVMGDSQASLFAHRCFHPGMGKVTLGSGSSVLLNIGPEHRPAPEGAVSTIAWTLAGKPTYCFEGIISYSAATIAWLKDQLGLIRSPQETEGAAIEAGDNGGVYLVPAFAGLSAPHWAPRARAAIVGMTAHSNRNHIIRAALESIAYQLHDCFDMMRSRSSIELNCIHADGGATRNRFLMQFIADITGLQIRAAEIAECSALGAALAGALGMGLYGSLQALERVPHEASQFEPTMPAEKVSANRSGWDRAVKQVLAGVE